MRCTAFLRFEFPEQGHTPLLSLELSQERFEVHFCRARRHEPTRIREGEQADSLCPHCPLIDAVQLPQERATRRPAEVPDLAAHALPTIDGRSWNLDLD